MRERTYKDRSQKINWWSNIAIVQASNCPELNILFLSDKYDYENTSSPIAQKAPSFFGNDFQKYTFYHTENYRNVFKCVCVFPFFRSLYSFPQKYNMTRGAMWKARMIQAYLVNYLILKFICRCLYPLSILLSWCQIVWSFRHTFRTPRSHMLRKDWLSFNISHRCWVQSRPN